jgi:hypothetical protein
MEEFVMTDAATEVLQHKPRTTKDSGEPPEGRKNSPLGESKGAWLYNASFQTSIFWNYETIILLLLFQATSSVYSNSNARKLIQGLSLSYFHLQVGLHEN